MKELLLSPEDLIKLKKYKFVVGNEVIRDNVDNSHEAHKLIENILPTKIRQKLNLRGFNLENIEITGSVGEGRMSEVYWIAILTDRFVGRNKRGKLSTQNGIYIVLLFDRWLRNAYLSIANGAEHMTSSGLERMSSNQIVFISQKYDIHHRNFKLNSNFELKFR